MNVGGGGAGRARRECVSDLLRRVSVVTIFLHAKLMFHSSRGGRHTEAREEGMTGEDDADPWDAVTTDRVEGKGEALRATRDLPKGARLLRVAPLFAVPYAAELTRLCGGCFQPRGAVCASCGSARLCSRCGAGAAGTLHGLECHALARLRDGEEGLTLAHSDLRLLLRALAVRSMRRVVDAGGDPAAIAAAEDGDVIVDDYDALEGLMSGMDGGDDGELPHDAVATIAEVAKQARFLLAASCRCSMDECVRTLGRLQLNGFEMTASEPEEGAEEAEGGRHRPVGVGVFPSASYTNHSCAPNCAQRFDAHGCIVVETARDVRVGEELTIPYVDVRLGRRERRERLRKNFAFDCACERCAAEAD